MKNFKLVSKYNPAGDQPKAIDEITQGINDGEKFQTLLGVTGSGKTFTISNVIERVNKPVLVISHNKTLAAQLYSEFKSFFPENAVEFFISYYDYYQPEAYIVSNDVYIEKDFAVNEEIDRLRLRATTSLIEGRRDVIIVASVSCIYGIGAPQEYADQIIFLSKGMVIKKKDLARKLVDIFYVRNDVEFTRGAFRVRGDVIDIIPAYQNEEAVRIQFFDDEIEKISIIDPLTGEVLRDEETVPIYPAKYFVSNKEKIRSALLTIEAEMAQRVEELRSMDKFLEAQRLEQRTRYDIEMIKEVGYCSGIENYSRHLDMREPGTRPYCLFDYFSKNDYLLIIDESHVTIPQIRAMYNGDKMRKMTLVEHGFRLPSALDNRPMKFEEFEQMMNQTVFISATPGDYELTKSEGVITELIIRPTGLLDPEVVIRPTKGQIDNLLQEIKLRSAKKERVLVTTLTKKMAEDLADYFDKLAIKCRYIHSEVDALERVEILRDLRLGEFDVLIGVNLLREGLDLPEVSLVAIIDADKEGFLRSERSLLQTAGRTARNAEGLVILYADKITDSMSKMISETERRRKLQTEYNEEHGITPQTIYKSREDIISSTSIADIRRKDDSKQHAQLAIVAEAGFDYMSFTQKLDFIQNLTDKMVQAAEDLDFEQAAALRDEIQRLRNEMEKRRS